MMKKVDGVEGNVKDAWHWVKKVVWEYESIRNKAMEWKEVYEQVTQAVSIIGKTQYSWALIFSIYSLTKWILLINQDNSLEEKTF